MQIKIKFKYYKTIANKQEREEDVILHIKDSNKEVNMEMYLKNLMKLQIFKC